MTNTAGKKLCYLRKWLGLTQKDVALKVGCTQSTIKDVEHDRIEKGKVRPRYEKLLEAEKNLDDEKFLTYFNTKMEEKTKIPDASERVFRLSREQLEKRNRKIVQNFAAGKRYRFLQGAGDKDFIFEYVKKEGIHHMFIEIHGGWSRTYTDSQLTEKKFEEVENA